MKVDARDRLEEVEAQLADLQRQEDDRWQDKVALLNERAALESELFLDSGWLQSRSWTPLLSYNSLGNRFNVRLVCAPPDAPRVLLDRRLEITVADAQASVESQPSGVYLAPHRQSVAELERLVALLSLKVDPEPLKKACADLWDELGKLQKLSATVTEVATEDNA